LENPIPAEKKRTNEMPTRPIRQSCFQNKEETVRRWAAAQSAALCHCSGDKPAAEQRLPPWRKSGGGGKKVVVERSQPIIRPRQRVTRDADGAGAAAGTFNALPFLHQVSYTASLEDLEKQIKLKKATDSPAASPVLMALITPWFRRIFWRSSLRRPRECRMRCSTQKT
jgi:hypothetical protein